MSIVTAKFKVSRVAEMGWATEIEMTPDYADGRNRDWAEATPAGICRLTVRNEVAARQFKNGAAVTLRFEFEDDE